MQDSTSTLPECNRSSAPEGFTPEYDWKSIDPETGDIVAYEDTILDYVGPAVVRPGFSILPVWTPGGGFLFFVDHEDSDPYTLAELRDLRDQLDSILKDRI